MRFKRYLLASAVLAGCAWGASAQAQDGDDASARTGNEIVVTAQFRDQSLQDTPLAISAVTGDMLAERGQTNVYEIANQVPNVTLKPTVAAWGPSLVASIRGVGQYNFNPALEPGVGVFVDDVYYATLTGSLLDLLDVERVEVLRGPQGTLTGRNSIGGAIRLITKQPSGDNSGFIELTGGSRKLLGARGAVDFRVSDSVAARISASLRSQEGYVENLDYGCVNPTGPLPATVSTDDCKLGPNFGGVGNQAVRGQVLFTPSDTFNFLLSANYVHEDHTGPGGVLTYANFDDPETNPAPGVPLDSSFICGRYCNFATFEHGPGRNGYPAFASSADPRTYYEGWGVSGTANLDLTDALKLTSITAYREYTSSFASDDDLSPAREGIEATKLSHKFFSQEARVNADLGMVELTVGGFYSWQHTNPEIFFDIRPWGLQYSTDDDVPAETAAAFATGIVHVTDALTLTGGLRYTHEKKEYTFYQYRMDGTINDPNVHGKGNVSKAHVVDYRFSIDYRWTPEVLTYFTMSSGFKGGGINPFPSNELLIRPFGPEKLKNYEIGLKTDLFDRRLQFNAAAFINDYSGVQLTRLSCPEFGAPFCSLVVNAGNAHNKGFEAELTAEPVDGLLFNGSVSYLDFEFTEIDASTGLPLTSKPPFTPEWKWAAGLQYAIDLGSSTLTPRIDVSYQSHVYTNAANAPTNRIDAYTVANAHLTWATEDRDLSVALHVNNLFDKYYFLNNFDLTGTSGVINAFPAAPREFSLVVRKEF